MQAKNNWVILAHGEITGHCHRFEGENTCQLVGNKLTIWKPDDLKHEEHTYHNFEPGLGEMTIQRQYIKGSLRRAYD